MKLCTPKDVRDYNVHADVSRRSDFQLEYDILEAEREIFNYVGHEFDDSIRYPKLPEEVKLAAIKLALYNALINMDENFIKGYKSVNLAGELQFTFPDGEKLDKPILSKLLSTHVGTGDGFVQQPGTTKLAFKMRFL